MNDAIAIIRLAIRTKIKFSDIFPDSQLHVELIRNDNIQERPPTRRGSKIREICSRNSINTGGTRQRSDEANSRITEETAGKICSAVNFHLARAWSERAE